MIKEIIQYALSQVGYREGKNNDNKYGKYFKMNNVAWCAIFVSYCARQCGIPTDIIPTYYGCGTGYNYFKKQKRTYNDPKAGDIIFFKPTKIGAVSAHTGIVVEVTDEYLYTVEGNASSNTDGVYKMCYKKGYSKILGFGRPNYNDPEIEIPSKKSVDEIAKEVINGLWGNGEDRKNKLKAAGYNSGEVQAKVNELLKGTASKKPSISYEQLSSGVWCRKGLGFGYKKYVVIPKGTKLEIIKKDAGTKNGYKWDKVKYNGVVVYLPNSWSKYL